MKFFLWPSIITTYTVFGTGSGLIPENRATHSVPRARRFDAGFKGALYIGKLI
jgi:hypothetical protein